PRQSNNGKVTASPLFRRTFVNFRSFGMPIESTVAPRPTYDTPRTFWQHPPWSAVLSPPSASLRPGSGYSHTVSAWSRFPPTFPCFQSALESARRQNRDRQSAPSPFFSGQDPIAGRPAVPTGSPKPSASPDPSFYVRENHLYPYQPFFW